jgi:hypothetical protein
MQMFVGFHSGCMITIFPERSLAIFALIVFLRSAPGNELHALGNSVPTGIFHQEMNVVGRHHVVEHAQTKPFFRLENPLQVTASIASRKTWKFTFFSNGLNGAKRMNGWNDWNWLRNR